LGRQVDQEFQLELVSGGSTKLTLPAPGEFASFYVFAVEYAGSDGFWQLLARLMAAAGRPVCALQEGLRQRGVTLGDATRSAVRRFLEQPGYGFGIFFNVDAALKDVVGGDNHKLLFLRDPRDLLAVSYLNLVQQSGLAPETSEPPSFGEFLQSPTVDRLAQRYRHFAELWRQQANTTLFRYEHALSGWHAIAAELVATLKLPLDPLTAAAIATDASAIGDQLPIEEGPPASSLSETEIRDLDARFEDVLAAFGYTPRPELVYSLRQAPAQSKDAGAPRAKSDGGLTPKASDCGLAPKASHGGLAPKASDGAWRPFIKPMDERDSVLMTRLTPNTSVEVHVLGRRVLMDVDAMGCRPVTGQPAEGEKTLAAYGCSFTYGIAVAAEETFCSQLQGMFPAWRVENHGVSGYGSLHNLIQLERNTLRDKAELVTFCWIEHHLIRNIADIARMQTMSEHHHRITVGQGGEERFPRARLDQDGDVQISWVPFPRYDLLGIDLSDFTPDGYYLDLICLRLFERAKAIVTGYGGHFFVTTLVGQLSAGLTARLADSGIPVVNASLRGKEYTCLPDDGHPNALAHRIYAQRIRDYLVQFTGERPAAD
jgi:hypothetical protein